MDIDIDIDTTGPTSKRNMIFSIFNENRTQRWIRKELNYQKI